jgi:hypothetical protein
MIAAIEIGKTIGAVVFIALIIIVGIIVAKGSKSHHMDFEVWCEEVMTIMSANHMQPDVDNFMIGSMSGIKI